MFLFFTLDSKKNTDLKRFTQLLKNKQKPQYSKNIFRVNKLVTR